MSEIVMVEPPQDRAVTLEEARQQLRLDGHDEDLLLGAKLDAAQAELEQKTGLRLCEQTLELQMEGWSQEITVPVRPCVVAEIRYTAANGATAILLEGHYVARKRHGFRDLVMSGSMLAKITAPTMCLAATSLTA